MLKPFLHGYLIHSKLYLKLRGAVNCNEYEKARKQKLKDKLDRLN